MRILRIAFSVIVIRTMIRALCFGFSLHRGEIPVFMADIICDLRKS